MSEATERAEAALESARVTRSYGVHPDAGTLERALRALLDEVRGGVVAEEPEWEVEHAVRWVETEDQPVTDIGAEADDIAALVIDQEGYAEAVERRVTPWAPVEQEPTMLNRCKAEACPEYPIYAGLCATHVATAVKQEEPRATNHEIGRHER